MTWLKDRRLSILSDNNNDPPCHRRRQHRRPTTPRPNTFPLPPTTMIPRFAFSRPAFCNQAIPPKLSPWAWCQQTRTVSSVTKPVELHYDKVIPPDGNATDRPLVILHGLLCVDYSVALMVFVTPPFSQRDKTELRVAFEGVREGSRPTGVCIGALSSRSPTQPLLTR